MLIRLEDIPDEGLQIDRDQFPSVFGGEETEWVLGPISVCLRREGTDVAVTGTFRATVRLVCGRCLEPFTQILEDQVAGRFTPRPAGRADEVELSADDLDVTFYDGESIDLGAFLRAETLLDVPMKPLCREDCLGFCPVCGGNRNLNPCPCETRPLDPRLAPFRALAERLIHQEK